MELTSTNEPRWFRDAHHRSRFYELLRQLTESRTQMDNYLATCYLLAILPDSCHVEAYIGPDNMRLHQLLVGYWAPEDQATLRLAQAVFTGTRADVYKCLSLMEDTGIRAALESLSRRYCGRWLHALVSEEDKSVGNHQDSPDPLEGS